METDSEETGSPGASLFLFFSSWWVRPHGLVGVVLTSSCLCPPVASPTHAGLPVDDARCLPHLSQLGAVRLPLNPPSAPILEAQCSFSSSLPTFPSHFSPLEEFCSIFLLPPPSIPILGSSSYFSPSLTFPISLPCLSICQDFQPFFLAALSAAPPPPPPPPSDELLDPPPKPPFADEEEEEEMLLRETCLMSMANKRVVPAEVGPSARRFVGLSRGHVT